MERFDATNGILNGTGLIEASAGTGKTYTITTLFLRLVLEQGLEVGQILVVTFTEAATKELVGRIRSRLKEELDHLERGRDQDEIIRRCLNHPQVDLQRLRQRIIKALWQFDEAAIFTIHGFCRRVLDEHAFESANPFDIEIIKNESPLIEEIVHDFWGREIYNASPVFLRYLIGTNTWPRSLMSLGALGAKALDAEVLPKTVPLASDDTAFCEAFSRARAIWQKERDFIASLLVNNSALKANSYKPEKMLTWFDALDGYLGKAADRSAEPPRPITGGLIGDVLTKLTPTALTDGTKKGKTTPNHAFFEAVSELVETNQVFALKLTALKMELLDHVRQELRQRKRLLAVRSFEDLLFDLASALETKSGARLKQAIRNRYRAALIDEFQDTDPVQYRIFHTLFAGPGQLLYLIGDPKQSIYGFRGADLYAYLKAASTAKENSFTLTTNWRTDPTLLNGINTLFARIPRPFYLPDIEYTRVEPSPNARDALEHESGKQPAPLQIRFVERRTDRVGIRGHAITQAWADENLSALTARDIGRLLGSPLRLKGRRLRPSDVAVLTRTNNEAGAMQEALQNLGIPSVLLSAESVFHSEEAEALLTLLNAIADAGHPGKIKAALSTDLFGLTGDDLLALECNDQEWDRYVLTFRALEQAWTERGIVRMMHIFLTLSLGPGHSNVTSQILGRARGERRLVNLRHLIELCHEAETEGHLGPHGLVRWFDSARQSRAKSADSSLLRLESDGDAIRIVTIHRSKGLEFPVVYLPFSWKGAVHTHRSKTVAFHDPQNDHRLTLDLGSDSMERHLKEAAFEETAESMRLIYVALTRAKHLLVVTWGAFHSAEHSPLARLLHGSKNNLSTAKEFSDYMRRLSDEDMLEDLKRLALETQPGTFSVEPLRNEDFGIAGLAEDHPKPLRERIISRAMPYPKVISSYSSLVAGQKARKNTLDEERDFDEASLLEPQESSHMAAGIKPETVPLSDFDRGSIAGRCLHKIMELLDFEIPRGEIPASTVDEILQNHGLSPSAWHETVRRAIDDILDTPLDPEIPNLKLRGLAETRCVKELEFIFPVVTRKNTDAGARKGEEIAAAFRKHGSRLPSDYVNQPGLSNILLQPGFLKGFIDLVFEEAGRYYLVDFKSNYLGPIFADYREKALCSSMASHHYYLQYHLYTLALHKFLERRLPAYDYDLHFGSVYYLFLRGMSPHAPAGSGIFKDRPPRALIEALSDLMEGNQ